MSRIVTHLQSVIFFFLIASCVTAQQYQFTTYTIRDGLSQSQVTDIIQDSSGYIWCGTRGGGLNRFDGHQFKTWTDADGLPVNHVRKLYLDRYNYLWSSTNEGLAIYNQDSITLFSDHFGFRLYTATQFSESPNGDLWIATNRGGLYQVRYNRSSFIDVKNWQDSIRTLPDTIFGLSINQNGTIWLGSSEGLYRFHPDSPGNFDLQTYSLPQRPNHNPIQHIKQGEKGQTWFATSRQVGRIDSVHPQHIEWTPFLTGKSITDLAVRFEEVCITTSSGVYILHNPNTPRTSQADIQKLTKHHGLASNQIKTGMPDREGNYWFGSSYGLTKYTPTPFTLYTKKDGLTSDPVMAVCIDDEHTLWASTWDGTLHHYYPEAPPDHQFQRVDRFRNYSISSIYQDQKGTYWLGTTESGLIRYNDGRLMRLTTDNGLKSNTIYSIHEDEQGYLWIGTKGGGLARLVSAPPSDPILHNYTKADGLSGNNVFDITQDQQGHLWLAIGNTGMTEVKRQGDSLHFLNFTKPDGLTTHGGMSVSVDSKNRVWLGTSQGVNMYNQRTDTLYHFTQTNGLASNMVYSLLLDEHGNPWFGTNKGVDKLDITHFDSTGKKRFRHYGPEQGFKGIECNRGAIFRDRKGNLWFGTVRGLVKYNPDQDHPNAKPPLTHIAGLELFFKPFDAKSYANRMNSRTGFPSQLTLPYDKNHLTFQYTGICHTNPRQVRYRYKLKGLDDQWSPPTRKTEAVYPDLSPGHYIFKVEACNSSGVWNEHPVTLFVTITPPWWQTWWAYGGYGLLAIIGIGTFNKVRERQLRQSKLQLERQVRQRTKELQQEKERVEEANRQITSSIRYAKRIQQAVLVPESEIQQSFPESFVLFKPLQIVSGDFYYYANIRGYHTLAIIDCTGHGIPGAFMSLIGNDLLNQIVHDRKVISASQVLNELDQELDRALQQEAIHTPVDEPHSVRDGMDLSLCVFHPFDKNSEYIDLQFSGAQNPIYIIRSKEKPALKEGKLREQQNSHQMYELPAHKQSIGASLHKQTFETQRVRLRKYDTIYLFTDGFPDQFGGAKGKKFMYPRFRKLLLEIQHKPMDEQKQILNDTIEDWMAQNNEEQIDDICILGIRV